MEIEKIFPEENQLQDPEFVKISTGDYNKLIQIAEKAMQWKTENEETKKDIEQFAGFIVVITEKAGLKSEKDYQNKGKLFRGMLKALKWIIFGDKKEISQSLDANFLTRLLIRYGNLLPENIIKKDGK